MNGDEHISLAPHRLAAPLPYSGRFWLLGAFLIMMFAAGGSQRADIASLAFLRPIAILVAAAGLWQLRRTDVTRHAFSLGMAASIVALTIIHLIPLPPSIWSALPERDLIVEIDRVSGLGAVWRPISLVPPATWNALFALGPPIATLILAVQLNGRERIAILLLVLAIGVLSALVGVLQLTGAYGEALYFYAFTNMDSAVGLFANRNHQAAFLALLFPLLAAYASPALPLKLDSRIRASMAIVFGLFLLPLIIVVGSRAGLVIAMAALVVAAMIYWRSLPAANDSSRLKGRRRALWVMAAIAALLLTLTTLAILLNRDEAIDRSLRTGMVDDSRLDNWKMIAATGWEYFPVGSGIGSFADVYKSAEPYQLLDLKLFNHAHNDWLEIFMTAGLPALILAGIGIIAFVVKTRRWWKSPPGGENLMAGAGLCTLFLLALASLVDYPLRVPALSCLFAIAMVWVGGLNSQALGKK